MDDDLEIGDVEDYRGVEDEGFSHAQLIMSAMRKVLDAATHEMRQGWTDIRYDKNGNVTSRIYHEDTRKVFIESVKTCLMFMACDFDEEADKNIPALLQEIAEQRKKFVEENSTAWNKLPESLKHRARERGQEHYEGFITHPLLMERFTEYELEKYREVFAELTKLTERLDFYRAEVFTA